MQKKATNLQKVSDDNCTVTNFVYDRQISKYSSEAETETKLNLFTFLKQAPFFSKNLSEKQNRFLKMPRSRFQGSISSPKVDLVVDMGNPFLNLTVDGFLKIGSVAATKVAAEEVYHIVKRGSVKGDNLEHSLKKMCKEGAYWGTVAGVYIGLEYGIEKVRGTRDWKNAMISGALTGGLVSASTNKKGDKIVLDAIAGGAVATAAEFINYLT